MQSTEQQIAALKRTDRAMYQLLAAIAVGLALSYFVDLLFAITAVVVLAAYPLYTWAAAEFAEWDRGGPAGEAVRIRDDLSPKT